MRPLAFGEQRQRLFGDVGLEVGAVLMRLERGFVAEQFVEQELRRVFLAPADQEQFCAGLLLRLREKAVQDAGDPIGLSASTASNAKNYAVPDNRTTGILAATASSVTGTVIASNHISDNHFGIFLEALSTVKTANVSGLRTNSFAGVNQAIKFVTAPVS